jgi:hypothetical protein
MIAVAVLLALWTGLLYVPFRWRPVGMYLFVFKAYAIAFAAFIVLAGVMVALIGARLDSSGVILFALAAATGTRLTILERHGRGAPVVRAVTYHPTPGRCGVRCPEAP